MSAQVYLASINSFALDDSETIVLLCHVQFRTFVYLSRTYVKRRVSFIGVFYL